MPAAASAEEILRVFLTTIAEEQEELQRYVESVTVTAFSCFGGLFILPWSQLEIVALVLAVLRCQLYQLVLATNSSIGSVYFSSPVNTTVTPL